MFYSFSQELELPLLSCTATPGDEYFTALEQLNVFEITNRFKRDRWSVNNHQKDEEDTAEDPA